MGGHEIILSDGGSDDRTVELAEPLVDRVVTSSPGRAIQMNQGAAVATGEVLWFLHADTIVPATAYIPLLSCLDGGTKVWGRFNVRLSGHQAMFRLIEMMMNLRSCITGIATGDQGIFLLRHTFEQLGGFTQIPLMEDIALSKKLKKISRPACIKRKIVTSSRRWEKQGIFATILLMWRLRLAYFFGVSAERLAAKYNP
jgi:rSAM/selenodomain-associated transferase 2